MLFVGKRSVFNTDQCITLTLVERNHFGFSAEFGHPRQQGFATTACSLQLAFFQFQPNRCVPGSAPQITPNEARPSKQQAIFKQICREAEIKFRQRSRLQLQRDSRTALASVRHPPSPRKVPESCNRKRATSSVGLDTTKSKMPAGCQQGPETGFQGGSNAPKI